MSDYPIFVYDRDDSLVHVSDISGASLNALKRKINQYTLAVGRALQKQTNYAKARIITSVRNRIADSENRLKANINAINSNIYITRDKISDAEYNITRNMNYRFGDIDYKIDRNLTSIMEIPERVKTAMSGVNITMKSVEDSINANIDNQFSTIKVSFNKQLNGHFNNMNSSFIKTQNIIKSRSNVIQSSILKSLIDENNKTFNRIEDSKKAVMQKIQLESKLASAQAVNLQAKDHIFSLELFETFTSWFEGLFSPTPEQLAEIVMTIHQVGTIISNNVNKRGG